MGKIAYLLGVEHKRGETMTVHGTIKDVHLYVNGLGWLTLTFTFEDNQYEWTIYHLNEDPYQEILVWFLQKGAELGGHEEKISIDGDTLSFDGGETWVSIYRLCDDMKTLHNFKGKSVILECEKFTENQKDLCDGAVSFDDGQSWFDIDAREKELDDKWFEDGGSVGIAVL